jgi:hypothetical protein
MTGRGAVADLEQLVADPRREIDGGEPRQHQRDARHPEQHADVLAGLALREPDRNESRHCNERAGQHRKRRRRIGERRRGQLVEPFLQLAVHHLHRDHRIIDQQAERNDERAERDAVQVDPHHRHDEERRRQHQRNGQRHDEAGPPAERQQRHDQHDADGLGQRLQEFMHRFADHMRLVRDAADLDADRMILPGAGQRLLDRGSDLCDVRARHHRRAKQHRLFALVARLGCRRIFHPALHLGDVAQAKRLLPCAQSELANVFDGPEPSLHVDAHRSLAGLDAPRRIHGVLAAERGLDVERRQPTLGQRRRRHLDEDALVLQAEQIDFGHARHAQENVARLLGEILQLRIRVALSGDGIERDVGVAKLVVEERADHALGQRLADVADLLARLVEGILDRLPAHLPLQVDEDVCEAGPRIGAQELEARRLLQLAFDLVDDLLLHLLDAGARPHHLHDHGTEREVRIFLLPDAQEGIGAGCQQQHQQERGETAMIDGPP